MADIHYRFIATGVPTVRDGFHSIGDAAKSSTRQVDEGLRRMRASARETAKGVSSSADAQAQASKSAASQQEKNAKYLDAIKDRHFREEQRRNEQIERTQQRTAARTQAQAQRETGRALANRRREIAKEIGDRQQHEGRLEQISRRGAERRADGERRHQQRLAEIKKQNESRLASITERGREQAKARSSAREFEAEFVAKRRSYELDKKRREIADKAPGAGIGGQIRGAVIGGAVATAALATGITGAAARDALRLQEVSNRLSIAARGAGEEAVDPAILRREFQQTAIKTPGVASADIADAVAQFVSKTGNLDMARKSQGVFATVASATGSSVQDVSAAAADLFQKFDITTIEGMADAMSALAFQGKAGAFELKDAASQFAKLSAAAQRFGIAKGPEGVKVLGGLTQIARTATGSPEQAATAVEAMFRQFTASSGIKGLRAIGVNPFADKGGTRTRDVRELIVESISKSGGNLTKLQGIFGEEGIRAISPIISAFNEAQAKAKGGGAGTAEATAAGRKAAEDFIRGAIEAPGDYAELQKDAAQAQQDASAKLAATWESLTAKIGESTTPAFAKLADAIANSPGAIDAFIGTVDNLITFFGMLITATQDVLEAFGLASKKKKSPEEVRDEERKKAADLQRRIEVLDKKRGGSWDEEQKLRKAGKIKEADAMAKRLFATSNLDDERATLAGKLAVSKRKVGEANAEVAKVQDQQKNVRSAAAFAEEYAALATPGQLDPETLKRQAMEVGVALRKNAGAEAPVNAEAALANENEAQRQLRVNQAMARRENAQNAGIAPTGGRDQADVGIAAAAKMMMDAANKMNAAAGKPNQASIVPAP